MTTMEETAGGQFRFNFSVNSADSETSTPSCYSTCSSSCYSTAEEKEQGGKKQEDKVSASNSAPNRKPKSELVPILPHHFATARRHDVTPSVFCVPSSDTRLHYISGQQGCDVVRAAGVAGGTELESLLTLSDSQHSDLIPGVYEGGLKLWECALDLVHFLSEQESAGRGFLSGTSVLELGCGLGLPGIYCATRAAKKVHFQDYNPEVLNCITILNVILNSAGANRLVGGASTSATSTQSGMDLKIKERFKFYSGDWSTLVSTMDLSDRYNLILTSETIYSLESQPKLLSVLKHLSVPGTGVVYVAAKMHYFGVGGGVASFTQLVEEDGCFDVTQCRKIHSSVPRVILKLTHKGH